MNQSKKKDEAMIISFGFHPFGQTQELIYFWDTKKITNMKRLLLLLIICFSSLSFGQLDVGLIAQYDFSGDALDVSGNNYHGVVNGAKLVNDRDGIQSSAYMFDGVDNSIEVTGFPTNFSNYSYCAWIKYADTAVPSGCFRGALPKFPFRIEPGWFGYDATIPVC